MNKSVVKRLGSICRNIEEENFLSFLEPSSTPSMRYPNSIAQSSRVRTPKSFSNILKSQEFFVTTSCKNSQKKQFLLKKNAIILERAQVLTKENLSLKRKIRQNSETPQEVFKKHAIKLSKEDFCNKNPEFEKEVLQNNIFEGLTPIKDILLWILDQKDEIPLKLIKSSIQQMLLITKTLKIDLESKIKVLAEQYQQEINELNKQIIQVAKNLKKEKEDTLNLLVSKNLELSNKVNELQSQISDLKNGIPQHNYFYSKRQDENTEMTEFFTVDSQDQKFSTTNSLYEKEEILNNMKKIEDEFVNMRRVITILDYQLQRKDFLLERYKNEVNFLKNKVSESQVKTNQKYASMIICNKNIINKQKPSASFSSDYLNFNDFTSFAVCIAGALEEYFVNN